MTSYIFMHRDAKERTICHENTGLLNNLHKIST